MLDLQDTLFGLLEGLWLCHGFDSVVIDLEGAISTDSGERLYLLNLTLSGRYRSLSPCAYHW